MIFQKRTKIITSNYIILDSDNGYRIICNASSNITITLDSAIGRYNFDLEIDNIGTKNVFIEDELITPGAHAHIGCTGTSWSIIVSNNLVTSVNDKTGDVNLDADDISSTNTIHKFVTANDLIKLSNLSGINTGDQDLTELQSKTELLDSKNTINDLDIFPFYSNSDSSNKNITWSLIKSILKAYFDTLYTGGGSNLIEYYEPITNGDINNPEVLFIDGDIIMTRVRIGEYLDVGSYYEPVTNGNDINPQILFDNGDIIMTEVNL